MCENDKLKVNQALEAFYADQRLDQSVINKTINYYPLGFVKIPFINLQARKNLLYLHDLNHLLFGYDTSLRGEAQLAALELGSGFPSHCRVGYLYSPFAVLPGIFLCPLKVVKAFLKGRHLKNACHIKLPKPKILDTSLADVIKILKLS